MADPIIANVDLGNVIHSDALFRDELLTFTGAATVIGGTILARDSSSLKLVPFVIGGSTNGNGIPKAVVTHDVTATGAGDIAIRAMQSGNVRAARLVVNADGDASNITAKELDELRDYKIIALDTQELNGLDNQ